MIPLCDRTYETCQVWDDPEMYDDDIVGESVAESNALLRDCEYCRDCPFHFRNATFTPLKE